MHESEVGVAKSYSGKFPRRIHPMLATDGAVALQFIIAGGKTCMDMSVLTRINAFCTHLLE